ncbi:hypothetical protein CPB86DRAFT_788652 [Serendipita vermifera]|nr:hypothetical protein CPB86DRAFT_788652 [Serendipita vermifera]
MMKTILNDPNCFTPNVNSRTFGHFWGILETRSYIRALITLTTVCEDLEKYDLAYDYDLRILTYNSSDNNGVRTNFNLLQTLVGRDLEAYNFSWHLLDQHLDYSRVAAENEGKDYPRNVFDKFKKEDIDPKDPVIHGPTSELKYADAAVLFTGALALFKMFGHCPKATSWLAAGHSRNPHILPVLLHPNAPSYPKERMLIPRTMGSYVEATDFIMFTKKQFCTRPVQVWLRLAGSELPKRKCDSPNCDKVEKFIGEWKRCTACYEAYYCSSECQKEHWKLPGDQGHKQKCKETTMLRNMYA